MYMECPICVRELAESVGVVVNCVQVSVILCISHAEISQAPPHFTVLPVGDPGNRANHLQRFSQLL